MKLKSGFVLRKIGDKVVVLPTNKTVDLNMMITLNDTGAFLWEHLQNEISEDELVSLLLQEYDVDEAVAKKSVEAFTRRLEENNFLA